MFKHVALLLLVLFFQSVSAQIKLNHNVGEDLIDSGMSSCEEEETWGRVFNLSDYGVTKNEQFIIRSGQVGISKSDNGAWIGFGVYSIDSNFPESEPVFIGSRENILLPKIDTPQIIQFDFEEPVVVPAGVERIMIVIGKSQDYYNPNSAEVIIAGTKEDTGESYYYGCRKYYSFTSTHDLEVPVPNANFFINATGEVFSTYNSGSSTTLSHSVCDDLLKPYITGCNGGGVGWSRDYILNDFGIGTNEEFVINSGQVGIQEVGYSVTVQFRIYKIDANFPDSFSENDLIGSSQVEPVPYFVSNAQLPKIFHVDFEEPVIVPEGVERILVEVYNGGNYAFPASTAQDTGTSWFKFYAGGCSRYEDFVDIKGLGWPDTKLYINVTGKVNHVANDFQMNISNICSEFLKEFSLTDASEVSSVTWDFGDPASGSINTSTDLSPFHDFSEDGTYTVTATVKGKNGITEVVTETIDVKEPPKAYGINNLEACETQSGTGVYSGFDTSGIKSLVLGNQTNKVVTFIDGSGNRYNELPNPFTNTVKNRETIKVRVARSDELCCYSETSFDLIINPLPDLSVIEDIMMCTEDTDGFATFDLSQIHADLSKNSTDISFYFQNGQQISNSQLDEVVNKVKDKETITVRATNPVTGCYNEINFQIVVTPPPIANTVSDITGCDDNNDGISEYFNTSNIETEVLGNQAGMEVSYFDGSGNPLPGPLPNPYTNTQPNKETLTVRVTNLQTGCFAETLINLVTSSKPAVNQPATRYACDTGNGIAAFDTSNIATELIGNQSGLLISYFDKSGKELSGFSNSEFINSVPYEQEITAKVEDPNSSSCSVEVSFILKTVLPPKVELEETYEICSLGESLELQVNGSYTAWTWFGPAGNIISEAASVTISAEGTYGLSVLEEKNGIICESFKEFELLYSEAPKIDEILYSNFSKDSRIEILASGDGVFEYSINGNDFQASNIFTPEAGGTYIVTVRDINGCGEVSQTINFLNYLRFFSPNNDGYNDRWNISGLPANEDPLIQIYDRYGKLLKQLSALGEGWDGTYNDTPMPADDYWFRISLADGKTYGSHFSLLR
ncbi:T9SS type B sorting domain-containing protein [Salinimicrobium sp. WS361]|uniref:T9SS type B sorting domain-containing protein n=1 Tax=Salinimicrobium sp. WS361 TaxID=3425123 RepID=UPI003D6FC78D